MQKKIKPSTIFYVYLLLDPRKDFMPFYVGKGKGSRKNTSSLATPSLARANKLKYNTISAIKMSGQSIIISIWAENLTEAEAFDIERSLIARWGRRGVDPDGILTNRTLGGEGLSGMKFSDEHRARIGMAHKGRTFSDETRKKMSEARIGTTLSEEHRAILSRAHKGKRCGAENPMYGKRGVLNPRYGLPGKKGKENGMFGRKHSPETIAKMSEARKKNPTALAGNQSARGDKKIYHFKNKDGGVFTGTTFDFVETFQISAKQIYNLKRGAQKTCRGWSILRDE